MTASLARGLWCWAAFAGAGILVCVVVLGVGLPIAARVGRDAEPGTALLGCGISWVAGCVGAIPVSSALAMDATKTGLAILASTVLRFLTVLLIVIPIALLSDSSRVALVSWVGGGYLAMLTVDTVLAIYLMKRFSRNNQYKNDQ